MDMLPRYVGLDYHEDTIRVCIMDPDRKVRFNQNRPNDVHRVASAIKVYGEPAGVVLEACCGAADFATKLRELTGWNVCLAHPGYAQRMKRGPDKTDCGDAEHLADLLRTHHVPEVWLADTFTRQLRRLVRYREGVKRERKNVKLRIRALLREERVVAPVGVNPWTKAWRTWLTAAVTGEHSAWVMERERKQLTRLESDLADVEERMAQATAEDPDTQRLLAQPGIGLVTAVMLRAEIGRFDRFGSGKQLARFCGVTPCNASSGRRQADAGLIKAGSSELRAVLIQTAQRLPRCDAHWREMRDRLGRTKPGNVAICAIANRWLRRLYHEMKQPAARKVLPESAA
jgi:transposase